MMIESLTCKQIIFFNSIYFSLCAHAAVGVSESASLVDP